MEEGKESRFTPGGRNLVLLGVISVIVAISTTGVSLAIYHNSGDIYLDRSRPGYLPDETEISDVNVKEEEYEFSRTGKLTIKELEEYLEHLDVEVKAIDAYTKPFDVSLMSDEFLGITEKTDVEDAVLQEEITEELDESENGS